MPKMTLVVPHKLGTEEAKRRITQLITDTKEQFGSMISDVGESWSDNTDDFSFRAMGLAVSGQLQVEANSVQIEINFPFAALPFKSRVEKEILSHAQALLA
jgi:hypothetical protein